MKGERRTCGYRENAYGHAYVPARLDESACRRDAEYQVGIARMIDVEGQKTNRSQPVVYCCEEHLEAAKRFWRLSERVDHDDKARVLRVEDAL